MHIERQDRKRRRKEATRWPDEPRVILKSIKMKTISPRSARAQKHPLMYPTLVNARQALAAWPRVTRFEIGKHTHLKCAGNLRNLTILIVAFWRFIFRRSPLSFLWTICVPLLGWAGLGWPTPSAEWFGKMERDWMVMVYLLFKA